MADKQIVCQRCDIALSTKRRKPRAPKGAAFVLSPADYIICGCECWIWRWAQDSDGYARIWKDGRREYVGAILLGIVGTGLVQIHACDNSPCVRPAHLRAGTHAENKADCIEKGRHAHGSKMGSSRLTEADIPIIRQRLTAGESQRSIARDYGVTHQNISRIKHRKTWKHV